jgi:hypothetical protein
MVLSQMSARLLVLLALAVPGLAGAQDGGTHKAKAKPSGKAPNLDLGLPTFGAIPSGTQLNKPKANDSLDTPTVTSAGAAYSVVRIQHAKAFARSPTGSVPMGGALEAIPLSGKPLSTEKFTTVVRVKSPARSSGSIELAVVDGRGDTLMSSRGELTFRGTKGDEVDYAIDWDPTPCRAGGDYQILVRVGGQSLGPFPLKLVEKGEKPAEKPPEKTVDKPADN